MYLCIICQISRGLQHRVVQVAYCTTPGVTAHSAVPGAKPISRAPSGSQSISWYIVSTLLEPVFQ